MTGYSPAKTRITKNIQDIFSNFRNSTQDSHYEPSAKIQHFFIKVQEYMKGCFCFCCLKTTLWASKCNNLLSKGEQSV